MGWGYCISVCVLLGFLVCLLLFCLGFLREGGGGLFDVRFSNYTDFYVFNQRRNAMFSYTGTVYSKKIK